MDYINLNGKIIERENASLPVDNGAFRYGYGLFETMLVRDSVIALKQYHWDRLFEGLKQLFFDVPALLTPAYLEEELNRTVKKNKLERLCRVRLQMFAGGGGLFSNESNHPGFVIECFPLEKSAISFNENGLVVGIASGLNKSIDSLSNLKSCNALIYAIAARQAKEHKWNDALLLNTSGNIIESTIANIFWVKNGVIYTPPLSEGCIAGVMRRHIMHKTPVTEKHLMAKELLDADEVFLTNAIRGIRWVKTFDSKNFNNTLTKCLISSLFF